MKKNKAKQTFFASALSIVVVFCFLMSYTTEIEGAYLASSISTSSEIKSQDTSSELQESMSSNSFSTSSDSSDGMNQQSSSSVNSLPESNSTDLDELVESNSLSSDDSAQEEIESSETENTEEFENIAPMVDENNLIRVGTFAELKTLLTGAKQDGVIVFTQDITATDGITVNSSWTDIVIDGKDPDTGVIHSYTELSNNDTNYTKTLFITSSNLTTKNFTLRNMNITGYNYYGTICVYETVVGVTLTYENVNYKGPQLTFNPAGTARYIDSTILLQKSLAGLDSQELAEVNKVEFGGNTTITGNAVTQYPIFALRRTNTSITVLSGANVSITNAYYLFSSESNGTSFEVEEGAYCDVSASIGMSNGSGSPISDLKVGENATLQSTNTGTTGYPCAYVRSSVNVSSNGSLILRQKSGAGSALYFTGSTCLMTLSSPKIVVLEVNGASTASDSTAIRSLGNTTVQANTQAINTWSTLGSAAITNSMSDIPTNIWNQQDGGNFTTSVILKNGYTASDFSTTWQGTLTDWTHDFTVSNFNLGKMKAVLFGSFSLDVNQPLSPATIAVQGVANTNSQVGVFYNSVQSLGSSGSSGEFSVPVDFSPLAVGDEIAVMTSHDLIKAYKFYNLEEAGELKFLSVPNTLPFVGGTIPSQPTYLPRQDTNWAISVEDTRGEGSTWRLDATVVGDISDGGSNVLDATLNFVTASSSISLNSTPTTIYNGTTGTNATTAISWQKEQGILLRVNSIGTIVPNVSYSTVIEWSLVDAP